MKINLLFLIIIFSSINIFGQSQIGNDIDGEAAGDGSGTSVSISSDGTRVAIGAIGNDGNGDNLSLIHI